MSELIYDVNSIKPLTDKVIQVFLQPQEVSLSYHAGQYVEIITSDGQSSPYSIANAPLGATKLEFHIRHTTDNDYSLKLIDDITQYGHVRIKGPYGQCTYRKDTCPIIFLATGTGFAPIKALLEVILTKGIQRPMHLYWGATTASDLYLDALPLQWQNHVPSFSYTPVLSNPLDNDQWQGKTGLIPDIVVQDYEDLSNCHVYAAGHPEMVLSALEKLGALGLPKENLFSDSLF